MVSSERLKLVVIAGLLSLNACSREVHDTAAPPRPTRAGVQVTSPQQLSKLLEQRWTLDRIRKFCIPERRNWNGCQNLVTGFHKGQCKVGAVWEGELFKGQNTGFDSISWYGDACDGLAESYSLNAKRGADYWNLEIGSPEGLRAPPIVEPPFDQPCFQGRR